MKCFNHHEKDAVAVCRHCGKALCPDCTVESEHGVSCSGRCERHMGDFNELLNRAEKDAQGYRSLGILLIVASIMMAILTMGLPGFLGESFVKALPIRLILFAGYGLTVITFLSGLFCYRQGMRS